MIFFPKYRRSTSAMKRLYNRIYRYYGFVERYLDPKLDIIISDKISDIPDSRQSTVLEYCCGSGILSVKLAPLFKSITSKDISKGMLERAKERAMDADCSITFSEGNILDINEPENSVDYVFISFGLHLFPLETEKEILKKLCLAARKAVIIIDHGRKWSLPVAIVEWFEGSYYDQFIKYDFKQLANDIGCSSFEEVEIESCILLKFCTNAIDSTKNH